MKLPPKYVRRLFFIRVGKGDAEQVRETILWGADPNWKTKKGRPALVKAVRQMIVEAGVVKALLDNGADAGATDELGQTALDHARRRLAKYEGRPRKPIPRSRSLSPGGELILPKWEWDHIDEMTREHPDYAEMYLDVRRKAAERVYDTRGNLERIVTLLENLQKKQTPPAS
ncbi:hypothetical protein PHYC_01657 [Phycisphaerales bacterium]|nr:hypothetical protein PHYC_01657 [Phycisphaerales bacterium]